MAREGSARGACGVRNNPCDAHGMCTTTYALLLRVPRQGVTAGSSVSTVAAADEGKPQVHIDANNVTAFIACITLGPGWPTAQVIPAAEQGCYNMKSIAVPQHARKQATVPPLPSNCLQPVDVYWHIAL